MLTHRRSPSDLEQLLVVIWVQNMSKLAVFALTASKHDFPQIVLTYHSGLLSWHDDLLVPKMKLR